MPESSGMKEKSMGIIKKTQSQHNGSNQQVNLQVNQSVLLHLTVPAIISQSYRGHVALMTYTIWAPRQFN